MTSAIKKKLPTRFGFLLINDFTLISLSSATEALRMANLACNQNVYTWRTISETGHAVKASDNLSVNVDCSIEDADTLTAVDAVIVCGGRCVEKNTSKAIAMWLRSASQKGISLGAVCTGSFVLAEADLLDGYCCSIHWENMAALTTLFPKVAVSRNIFTIDRDRYTSSGGTTPGDMMLHFIKSQCGTEVSASAAEMIVYETIRRSDDHQRVPLQHVIGHQSEKLVIAAELMEANVKEPISQEDLASYVDLSRRQLQRLFQRYLFCTPSRHYLQIRLKRARQLLRQTSMSLVEVSASTGFVSSSHFSKSYKEFYGHSPSTERLAEDPETNPSKNR